uniref:Uncharacterized protein n=1 Tax=Arundo donax TaxID=35708 RepID=A0A0A9DF72_ARUDO
MPIDGWTKGLKYLTKYIRTMFFYICNDEIKIPFSTSLKIESSTSPNFFI